MLHLKLEPKEYWSAGRLLTKEGLDDAYYVLMDKAWKLAAAQFGEDSSEYGQASNHMIGALTGLKRIDDAIYASREAIRVNTIHFGPDSAAVANDRSNLAARLILSGIAAEAASEWLAAIKIFESITLTGWDNISYSSALNGYSQYLAQSGNGKEALWTALHAVQVIETSGYTREIHYGQALSNAGWVQRNTGHCIAGRASFKRAVAAFKSAGVKAEQRDHADAIRMSQQSC